MRKLSASPRSIHPSLPTGIPAIIIPSEPVRFESIQLDEFRYRKQQLVETQFSILERKFGGDLKTRTFNPS
jgi:hypothetical protein